MLDEAADRSVDTVEEVALVTAGVERIGENGVDEFIAGIARAGRKSKFAGALRCLVSQAVDRELLVRHAKQRRILRGLQLHGVVGIVAEAGADVELLSLPGQQ